MWRSNKPIAAEVPQLAIPLILSYVLFLFLVSRKSCLPNVAWWVTQGTTVYCDHLPNTWRLVSKFKRECLNQRRWVCSCVVMWARVNSLIRLWLGNFASVKLTSHHVTNNITWFVRCSKDETKAAFSGHKTIKKYQRILVHFNDTQSSLIFC